MGRALIADSHLVEKYAAGRKDEICPCVACGQGCVGNADKMIPITCALNPLSGREASMPAVPKAETPAGWSSWEPDPPAHGRRHRRRAGA